MQIFPRNKTDIIISYILEHPNSIIKIVDIAKRLGVNKGSVSLTVKMLEKEKIVNNKRVNTENPIVKGLKILIIMRKFADVEVLKIIKKFASSAGIYGSSVKGVDTEESDIDIWIKPKFKISGMNSVKLSKDLEKILGKRVQLIILDKDKINSIKTESKNFYHSLVFGSITIFGDGIE